MNFVYAPKKEDVILCLESMLKDVKDDEMKIAAFEFDMDNDVNVRIRKSMGKDFSLKLSLVRDPYNLRCKDD